MHKCALKNMKKTEQRKCENIQKRLKNNKRDKCENTRHKTTNANL